MSRLTRDGTAEPVSRDQILRHARGQGNIHFPCSADHEQDWQPYPVDPYSAICDDHTYIHTYIHGSNVLVRASSKKSLIASRPSEHPPVRGKNNNVKTFRWDHRLQRPNLFSWHLHGFPDDGSNIKSIV